MRAADHESPHLPKLNLIVLSLIDLMDIQIPAIKLAVVRSAQTAAEHLNTAQGKTLGSNLGKALKTILVIETRRYHNLETLVPAAAMLVSKDLPELCDAVLMAIDSLNLDLEEKYSLVEQAQYCAYDLNKTPTGENFRAVVQAMLVLMRKDRCINSMPKGGPAAMRNTVRDAIYNLDVQEVVKTKLYEYCEANPDIFQPLTGKEIKTVITSLAALGTPMLANTLQAAEVKIVATDGPPLSLGEMLNEASIRVIDLRSCIEHGTETLFKHLDTVLAERPKQEAFVTGFGKPSAPTTQAVDTVLSILQGIQEARNEFDLLVNTILKRFTP